MFVESLLEHSQDNKINMVVVNENEIKGHNFEEVYNHAVHHHEKNWYADTSLGSDLDEKLACGHLTHVFVLLPGLISCNRLGAQNHLKFLPEKGPKYQENVVVERV